MKYLYYVVAALIFLALVNISSRWINPAPTPSTVAELSQAEPNPIETPVPASPAADENIPAAAEQAPAQTQLIATENTETADVAAVASTEADADAYTQGKAEAETTEATAKATTASAPTNPDSVTSELPPATALEVPAQASSVDDATAALMEAVSTDVTAETTATDPAQKADQATELVAAKTIEVEVDSSHSEQVQAPSVETATPTTDSTGDTAAAKTVAAVTAIAAAAASTESNANEIGGATPDLGASVVTDPASQEQTVLETVAEKTSEVATAVVAGTKKTIGNVVTAAQSLVSGEEESGKATLTETAEPVADSTAKSPDETANATAEVTTDAAAAPQGSSDTAVVAPEVAEVTKAELPDTGPSEPVVPAPAEPAAAESQAPSSAADSNAKPSESAVSAPVVTNSSGSGVGITKPEPASEATADSAVVTSAAPEKIEAAPVPSQAEDNTVVVSNTSNPASSTSPAASSGVTAPTAVRELVEQHPGKILMVSFWSADCLSCKPAFAWLNEMRRKYWAKGLYIIGVHQGTEAEADQFLAQSPASFEIINDSDAELASAFWLSEVPSTFIVGKDGSLIASHRGHSTTATGKYEDDIRRAINLNK